MKAIATELFFKKEHTGRQGRNAIHPRQACEELLELIYAVERRVNTTCVCMTDVKPKIAK